MTIERYTNGRITVTYDSKVCTHAGRCVKGLPGVFDIKRKPWIDVEGAAAEEIAAQVAKCPSGALAFAREDGAHVVGAADRAGVISFAGTEARIPTPEGERAVLVAKRGTLDVKLVVPAGQNRQTPHEQDEIYVVVRGRGALVHEGRRDSFGPGDILFVAAGVEHHYEDFGGDLALWRVFYGARGGEVPS